MHRNNTNFAPLLIFVTPPIFGWKNAESLVALTANLIHSYWGLISWSEMDPPARACLKNQ